MIHIIIFIILVFIYLNSKKIETFNISSQSSQSCKCKNIGIDSNGEEVCFEVFPLDLHKQYIDQRADPETGYVFSKDSNFNWFGTCRGPASECDGLSESECTSGDNSYVCEYSSESPDGNFPCLGSDKLQQTSEENRDSECNNDIDCHPDNYCDYHLNKCVNRSNARQPYGVSGEICDNQNDCNDTLFCGDNPYLGLGWENVNAKRICRSCDNDDSHNRYNCTYSHNPNEDHELGWECANKCNYAIGCCKYTESYNWTRSGVLHPTNKCICAEGYTDDPDGLECDKHHCNVFRTFISCFMTNFYNKKCHGCMTGCEMNCENIYFYEAPGGLNKGNENPPIFNPETTFNFKVCSMIKILDNVDRFFHEGSSNQVSSTNLHHISDHDLREYLLSRYNQSELMTNFTIFLIKLKKY